MNATAGYPVRVEGHLEPRLSRWLWLVKWFLAIPHYFVLVFLWIGFFVLSVVAFFAILFTGTYPRSIFDFNVGVLRWSWRVSYYTYGALGTDRYPPFTLEEVADYPAHLEVEYPQRLSRGLVLVKWWLLALPHYLIVGLLVGGGAAVTRTWVTGPFGGLIGILVLVAAVILAVTGTYPLGLFDFILGLNRWVLRVAAYAGLMTDRYPPFRLDVGGDEPGGGTLTVPPPPIGSTGGQGEPPAPPGMPAPPKTDVRRWTAGRIVAVVIGALLGLTSFGLASAGGVALWASSTQRDAAGYLVTPYEPLSTGTYALTTRAIDVNGVSGETWTFPEAILGSTKIEVSSSSGGSLFVGIGPTPQVDRYLSGMSRGVVTEAPAGAVTTIQGGPPSGPPGQQTFWTAQRSGSGKLALTWKPSTGSWTVVVMNADASRGLDVSVRVGAKVPALVWIAVGLIVAGALFAIVALLLILIPIIRVGRERKASGTAQAVRT